MRDRFLKRLRRPPSKERDIEVFLCFGMAMMLSLESDLWDWLRPLAWLAALWYAEELLRRAVWRRGARRAALS
ncbi:hypothetical protein ACFYOG_20715 [Streptomyces sp. NPDC007818]|uniref:hypothetical protein n=1 Tax=Streptomyces sp. NPDC007818 TaxID=3364780 RepID=UPI003683422A